MPEGAGSELSGEAAGGGPDRGVIALYGEHYRSLVGVAGLLLPDLASAEQVVQDAFVALHSAWQPRGDGDQAVDFLLRSVVRRSRRARHSRPVALPIVIAGKIAARLPGESPDAQPLEHQARPSAIGSALRGLPRRQREVLVLRYYADLSEARIAAAMNISASAVGRLAERAVAALRSELLTADSPDARRRQPIRWTGDKGDKRRRWRCNGRCRA